MFPEEKVETVELANGAPPQVAKEAIREIPIPEADQMEPEPVPVPVGQLPVRVLPV